MDPQQRLLLETSWEALERRRHRARRRCAARRSASSSASDEQRLRTLDQHAARAASTATSAPAAAAAWPSGRIAYILGLEGRAVTVDTACSSSLVALHLAVPGAARGRVLAGAGRRRRP